MRVSGSITDPWSGRVVCQPRGRTTVTPAAATRCGAFPLAGQARRRAARAQIERRVARTQACPRAISPG